MRLNMLTLNNFGMFRDAQTIDLVPKIRNGRIRPIVIVGGQNGAGKSTILEAIRLCLYGKLSLEGRVSQVLYDKYLRDRIHRVVGPHDATAHASVALGFDYSRSSQRNTYYVQREWSLKGNGDVVEQLTVLRDGLPLAEVESQLWSDFIRSMVPPGLSQLFFFDGEQIQKLAEEGDEGEALAESVRALLGLDLVERLQADLDIYVSRELRSDGGSEVKRLQELAHNIGTLEKELEQAKQERAGLKTRLEYVLKQAAKLENKLVAAGEGLTSRRVALSSRKESIEQEIVSLTKSVRELCDGALPFALCPRLCSELLSQMEAESLLAEHQAAKVHVEQALGKAEALVTRGPLARELSIGRSEKKAIATAFSELQESLTAAPRGVEGVAAMHGLSRKEKEEFQSTIAVAMGALAFQARRDADRIAVLAAELRNVQAHLNRTPDDSDIAPKVRELAAVHDEQTRMQVALVQKEEQIKRHETDLAALRRENDKLIEDAADAKKRSARLQLARKIRSSMGFYLEKLTSEKVRQLEIAATECFSRLARKSDLVGAVRIDPKSFVVKLLDQNGREIEKRELSAGEKQIYAVSMLWALGKVSGRPLPVVIDTPLGRLDSQHRENLVLNYFPVASHQVIVLSTDTEVDARHFAALSSSVSHAFRLAGRPGAWTEVEPGYFWKEAQLAEPAA